MDIILSSDAIDLQECDILVAGFFKDEKPLKGSAGWLDWRLNGTLSRFVIDQKLTGEWKETTMIPSQGRVTAPILLLFGLGEIQDYSYLRLREFSPHLLETLKNLNASRICISLPYGEAYNVDCGKLAEVIIEGITDCLDLEDHPLDENWIKGLTLFFAEGEEHFSEILVGVQTAKSMMEDRFPIRVFAPTAKSTVKPGGQFLEFSLNP
jgi:hypothetical protein